jgi:putative AlgH/UPF0301 family transcriptional regulator
MGAAEAGVGALAERWAHPLGQVEVGACLLATRSHEWPRATDYLRRAVVLVTDVDADAGVHGLLLNRPTGRRVASSPGVLARVGAEFADNRVHLGGDCCMGYLEVLHPRREIDGSREIVPGLYRGGVNACRAMVAARHAHPQDFQILISYAQWTWQQLAEELALNAWDVVAVSPAMLAPAAHVQSAGDGTQLWDDIRRALQHSL